MKGTSAYRETLRVSLIGDPNVVINGVAVDCKGFEEAMPFVATQTLAGTLPTADVKWQESSDGSTNWTDITGAVHNQLRITLADIVASVNLATGATLTLAGQPPKQSPLNITIVDTTPSIVAGTLYIQGTRAATAGDNGVDQPIAEILSIAAGAGTYKTVNSYKTVTSIKTGVVAGVAGTIAITVLGGAGDETIKVGTDNTGQPYPQVGSINLINRKRYLRAVNTKGGTVTTVAFVAGLILQSPKLTPVLHPVTNYGPVFRVN